jgi:hypothetical protein
MSFRLELKFNNKSIIQLKMFNGRIISLKSYKLPFNTFTIKVIKSNALKATYFTSTTATENGLSVTLLSIN